MSKGIDDKLLGGILIDSHRGIADLLRSAAHPTRMKVLALLFQGEHEFSRLMQYGELSKTSLANHLSQLIEKRLVQKTARGKYELTVDGRELLNAAATMYRNSTRREEERRMLLSRRYTEGLTEGKPMSRNMISKKVEYQPCWLSYTGAVAGSLKALGTDCDAVDVGGYSGYAFLINVAKGITCPSGPTALPSETWKQIHDGTESLGWTIKPYVYPHSYPAKEGSPTPEEMEIARKLFEKIKEEIDEKDRPVVLWGLVVPEYGIVNGYEGNSYLTSTFRRLANQPEDPVIFHDLKSPGCIDALFFHNRVEVDATMADKEALRRAIRFATAEVPIHENYAAGPSALDEWARVLENVPKEKQNYHGNSYVGACVCEGRAMSAEFLKRLAKKHSSSKHSKHLLNAAENYEKGAELMKEFTKVFPFKFQGEMPLESRKKGAETLRKVKPYEEAAIEHMKTALKNWQ